MELDLVLARLSIRPDVKAVYKMGSLVCIHVTCNPDDVHDDIVAAIRKAAPKQAGQVLGPKFPPPTVYKREVYV